jgi:hypothetical protein
VTRRFVAMAAMAILATAAVAADEQPAAAATNDVAEISADLDGDGRADTLRVEHRGDRIVVTLRGSVEDRVEFDAAEFACTPVTWSPDCGMEMPALSAFRMDADFIRESVGMFGLDSADFLVEGAESVTLPIGETDPFHFVWNSRTRRLTWLRL